MSLLGVAIVPFVRRNSKLAVCYKYIIILLISMGVAALITDALLHLIPNVSTLSLCPTQLNIIYLGTFLQVNHPI